MLFSVWVPPAEDPDLSRAAINVLVSLEYTLMMADEYDIVHPDDVRSGLVEPIIEVSMQAGAARMLERLAGSPRLQVWITSHRFGRYGEDYIRAIRAWLEANGLSAQMGRRIGYTNLIMERAVHYTPRAVQEPVSHITEGDIFDQIRRARMTRFYRGEQATC